MRSLIVPMLAMALAACGPKEEAAPVERGPAEVIRTPIIPWPEATEVRLFVEDLPPLNDDGDPRMSKPAGTRLTGRQRAALAAALAKVEVRGGVSDVEIVAGCFFPHHFFRYFDSANRQIGEIAVCYCCGGELATPALVEERDRTYFRADLEKLEPVITELGYPTDVNC